MMNHYTCINEGVSFMHYKEIWVQFTKHFTRFVNKIYNRKCDQEQVNDWWNMTRVIWPKSLAQKWHVVH